MLMFLLFVLITIPFGFLLEREKYKKYLTLLGVYILFLFVLVGYSFYAFGLEGTTKGFLEMETSRAMIAVIRGFIATPIGITIGWHLSKRI